MRNFPFPERGALSAVEGEPLALSGVEGKERAAGIRSLSGAEGNTPPGLFPAPPSASLRTPLRLRSLRLRSGSGKQADFLGTCGKKSHTALVSNRSGLAICPVSPKFLYDVSALLAVANDAASSPLNSLVRDAISV